MNAPHSPRHEGHETFLDLVDFKWLMAGLGWWVDLTRLQRDSAYVSECLQRALSSDSELIHGHRGRLLVLRHRLDPHCNPHEAAPKCH